MKELFERIAKFRADRSGLPPKLHVELDCFEDAILEACITDEHTDILFTADTGVKNDGTAAVCKMAHATPDYRIAEILVDGYNEAPALLSDCQSAITELQALSDEAIGVAKVQCDEKLRLKTQLEKAEALLYRCSNIRFTGSAINQDIAAYFREKEKPCNSQK